MNRYSLALIASIGMIAAGATSISAAAEGEVVMPLGGQLEELAGRFEEVEEIVEELEIQLIDVEERIGSRAIAHAFDGLALDIGGFLTQTFTGAFGRSSGEAVFDQTLFELLIRAQVTEDWSLFTALGFLRAADLDFVDPANPNFRSFANRVPQIIAWANYRESDGIQLQIGRFVTPQGIINIEHFPPVLLELNQPQFLRPFPGATLFPNFMNGAQFHGKQFVGKDEADTLGYHVFTGHFVGGDADDFITGGRLYYQYADSGATLGFNAQHGKRTAPPTVDLTNPATFPPLGGPALGNFSITPVRSLTTNRYDQAGIDFLYDYGNWLWKTEAFYSWEYDGAEDRWAIYTQPARRICENVLLFYRYDFLDAGQTLGQSQEHVLGINYLPVPNVRTRAVYTYKTFEQADTIGHFFQLSATVSF